MVPAISFVLEQLPINGKFVVRIPKSLHAALAAEAEVEGISLNQLIVAKLAVQLAGSMK